jgi:putative transposase
MESFNSLLQIEKINYGSFRDLDELKDEIVKYIAFYNTVRPHSSLAYLTPDKYEEIYSGGLKYHDK